MFFSIKAGCGTNSATFVAWIALTSNLAKENGGNMKQAAAFTTSLSTSTAGTNMFKFDTKSKVRASTLEESLTTTTTTRTKSSVPWTLEHGLNQEDEWAWAYTSVNPEEACTSYVCDNIEGEVPSDIQGTLYRIGSGNFERGEQRYEHFLDGDGFVAAFTFHKNGTVTYKGNFVETEYYKEEHSKDEVLYRNVFGTEPSRSKLFDVDLKNAANTNVVEWGGRLFAFWEGGKPYELNPETLETLPTKSNDDGPLCKLGDPNSNKRGVTIDQGGPIDIAAGLGRAFTAHPHVIENGERLVGFRSAQNIISKDIDMEFVEYDKAWNEIRTITYSLPKAPSAPHDFAISKNYYIMFQNRVNLDSLPFMLGIKAAAQCMEMQPREPTILHLIPRNSKNKEPIQLEVPPFFAIHMIPEAIEEEDDGSILHIYSSGWDLSDERYFPKEANSLPFLGSWKGPYPDFDVMSPSYIYKTTINLKNKEVISHDIFQRGTVMEWATQNPTKYNEIYFGIANTQDISLPATGLAKLNLQSGKSQYWWVEPKTFCHEMIPVKKKKKKDDDDDDGSDDGVWLLTLFTDATNKRTTLAIMDSESWETGPICRIHLRHKLTYGLHGSFCPSSSSSSSES